MRASFEAAAPSWGLRHLMRIRGVVFALALAPAAWLCGEAALGALGAHPLNRLLHVTGHAALVLLLVTLAITPLRRLSAWTHRRLASPHGKRLADWSWLIRLRRMLGLFVFAYASAHLALYVWLDVGPQWAAVADDVRERPFVALGALAWALLLPLAVTSTDAAIRRLGPHWRTLHRLVHAVLLLAIVHGLMQRKVGQSPEWIEIGMAALLLGVRLRPSRAAPRRSRERRSSAPDREAAAQSGAVRSITDTRSALDSPAPASGVTVGRTSR